MLKTSSGQSGLAGLEKKLAGRNPADSDIPAPVRKSVRFMLAGAAVTTVLGLFWLIAVLTDKNAFTDASGKTLSNGQFATSVVQIFIFEFLFPAGMWLLMARFNRSGMIWARIVASALCAIDTYLVFGLVNSLRAGTTLTVADIVDILLTLVAWILGGFAIALLWRRESSVYFKARSARG